MDNSTQKKKPLVTHFMADGKIKKDLKGYGIPYNEQTKTAYRILKELENM